MQKLWILLGFYLLSLGSSGRVMASIPSKVEGMTTESQSADDDQGWEKISDDNGIVVFKREIPGSPILAFKGRGKVNSTVGKLAMVLADVDHAVDWVDSLEDIKILHKRSELDYVVYQHIGTPIVLKDREFVTRDLVEINKPGRTLTLRVKSVEDLSAPKTNYIRGDMDSVFILKALGDGSQTEVTTEIFADPKGSVAKWIVNLFQKSWPRNTIEKFRKQALNPRLIEHPYYKKVMLE